MSFADIARGFGVAACFIQTSNILPSRPSRSSNVVSARSSMLHHSQDVTFERCCPCSNRYAEAGHQAPKFSVSANRRWSCQLLTHVVPRFALSDLARSIMNITLWSPHTVITQHHGPLCFCLTLQINRRLSQHNEMPADRVQKSRSPKSVPDLGDPDRKRVLNVLAQRRYRKSDVSSCLSVHVDISCRSAAKREDCSPGGAGEEP